MGTLAQYSPFTKNAYSTWQNTVVNLFIIIPDGLFSKLLE